jgi:hypothetical protein
MALILSDYGHEVEAIVIEMRQDFETSFSTNKEKFLRLGKALQPQVADPRQICVVIKKIFAKEIRKGLISKRAIEKSCLPEWKDDSKIHQQPKRSQPSVGEQSSPKLPESRALAMGDARSRDQEAVSARPVEGQEQPQHTTATAKPSESQARASGTEPAIFVPPHAAKTGEDGKLEFKVHRNKHAHITLAFKKCREFAIISFSSDGAFLSAQADVEMRNTE